MPATQYVVLGGMISVEVFSCAAGIVQTGDISFGIGSTATADGTLATTEIDLAAIATITLVAGAGTAVGVGPAAGTFLDGAVAAGNDIHFNIGVLDADITADAAVNFTAIARIFWLDLGRGQ
jgi:hypothetical protein